MEIVEITGNGGNVYVKVYDANSNQTFLEANPGVGGTETFYFNGESNYPATISISSKSVKGDKYG